VFYEYDKKRNGGQLGLLDYVKRVLRKTYIKTPDISRNGQVMTIHFNDFIVDVISEFYRKGRYITGNIIR
jgi:hypothetical protein